MENKFAFRLREARIDAGLSRKQLAEKLFVSERLVCFWENGKRECNFNMLLNISNILSCSIDYLLGKINI